MLEGIAVHLRGRGLQHRDLQPFGQAQHVDRAENAGLGRLHRIELVVHGRGRAGQVEDLIRLHIERERHVVAQELESRVAEEGRDVVARARVEIVHAQDFVSLGQQTLAQVRAYEP